MEQFHEKVALVVGGGSGIGRAIAVNFAKQGAKVVVAGRTSETLNETRDLIREAGGEALSVQTDVSSYEEVQHLIEATVDGFGRLDFACNGAGAGGNLVPIIDVTEDDFDTIVSTNLKGVWLCMKFQIQQMLKQGYGSIVNISSINGLAGTPNASIYAASKAGVVNLTKTASLEYAKSNIRINVICPGAIHAPLLEKIFNDTGATKNQYESIIPQGRIGDPNEIAESAVWLCSDHASYINGNVMTIDGGVSAKC
ncbi:glucose 1-dehydrogenase [Kroppenstedtia sanguinis]|uniref:Glucose 1-dehydrogenase n=1 Tax=Kroppenstedtia sanguinis TaxID=1380684 RepID=A0ABW4C8F8_9BACL